MIQPIPSATISDDAFTLAEVSVRFGAACALSSVSLRVRRGERVAFIGPSGAGKTTLLRVLNGSVRPTSGQAHVEGQPIASLSPRQLRLLRGRIGFVHQDLNLVPNLRVIQNVLSGQLGRQSLLGSLRSMLFPSRSQAARVHEILERVGIAQKLYERTDRLSGGQQQRVAISRALYQQPAALLADEPLASVDPERARDLVSLLTDISVERGLTLCVSLHNLELARAYFPRIVALRDGRVMFDRLTSEVDEATFRELYRLGAAEPSPAGAFA